MRKSIVVGIGVVLLASGCSSNQQQSNGAVGINDDAREMTEAKARFDNAKDPAINADTHFAAGQLKESEGSYELALVQYKEALKIDPNHLPTLFRMGLVYSELKRYPEAIDSWKHYIAATHESAAGYSNLAYCQELSGDVPGAESSYQTGLQHDPNSQLCHVNYGLMLTRQNRIDEAKTQFAAVLTPAQVHYNLASVFQQEGKKAAARAEYLEAIKADPSFVDARTRLAEMNRLESPGT
ncbi:MAG TPA: tetratricopeptide repeat protein [Tepidisphaeraceae bacterium]|jgi:tetratricopeptide (TPR) repeat protein|nr:tetratricopeptide repeat protein [Tepidisphaeraceae bacterium]